MKMSLYSFFLLKKKSTKGSTVNLWAKRGIVWMWLLGIEFEKQTPGYLTWVEQILDEKCESHRLEGCKNSVSVMLYIYI
jgi:hypothetical protein